MAGLLVVWRPRNARLRVWCGAFRAAESGSFARRVADWPVSDFAGLLGWLGRNGSRLGGTTGQYVMRHMGKDSFVLSASVVARLQAEGVIAFGSSGAAPATRAKTGGAAAGRPESGRSFNEIGRVSAQNRRSRAAGRGHRGSARLAAAAEGACMTDFLTTPQGRRLAYNRSCRTRPGGRLPRRLQARTWRARRRASLHDWATARGRAFLRFDYSGHGQSSGRFDEGCIGDWARCARAALEALTEGPQILVGSSMGGWIALLLARAVPDRVAGLVGIAAAPDFTVTTWQRS
jgi:hypothetical protein